jgi:hypothetical protein
MAQPLALIDSVPGVDPEQIVDRALHPDGPGKNVGDIGKALAVERQRNNQ